MKFTELAIHGPLSPGCLNLPAKSHRVQVVEFNQSPRLSGAADKETDRPYVFIITSKSCKSVLTENTTVICSSSCLPKLTAKLLCSVLGFQVLHEPACTSRGQTQKSGDKRFLN